MNKASVAKRIAELKSLIDCGWSVESPKCSGWAVDEAIAATPCDACGAMRLYIPLVSGVSGSRYKAFSVCTSCLSAEEF